MKKIKLFALAFVLGTVTIFATNDVDPNPPKKEIKSQIVEMLQPTRANLGQDINVNISFTFSSEGEIVVKRVSSRSKKVLDYIRKNVNGKTLENPGKKDKLYSMILLVKPL